MKNERKEELKDEMKNRISLALKDPILQQGFEIICKENAELNYDTKKLLENAEYVEKQLTEKDKQIADLEKENTELKNRNTELKGMYAHSAREAGTYKQFLELKEKENTELKTLMRSEHEIEARKNNRLISQLTKAKELLQRFIETISPIYFEEDRQKVKTQAEQFLNSEVEK